MRNRPWISALALSCLLWTASVGAFNVGVRENAAVGSSSVNAGLGRSGFTDMDAALEAAALAAGTVIQRSFFSDFTDVGFVPSDYDALWVDLGHHATADQISGTEATVLQAFIATGRPVVLMGEGSAWGVWNTEIIEEVAGGTHVGAGSNGSPMEAAFHHPLTAGLDGFSPGLVVQGFSVSSGGQSLFETQAVALWGDALNVLTILDAGAIGNGSSPFAQNQQFRTNLAGWILEDATAVPLPSALLLLSAPMLLLAGVCRHSHSI